ncbi:unnamed protein product [Rotaria sordida]|uniref:Uncharacterized protein n=1 Tax=Rotaria sordida TaxID=392033 RepID=A0A815TZT3_9BILA|nr:unnamed protein product [Rotaria sordida]CAF1659091.1 unnamed protein product [Rotaria sordida]
MMNLYTCVGKKGSGGFALPHLNTMIISYRIKCGLRTINMVPKILKFYAYQHVGIQLRTFAPWIWTNLVPHFNHDDNFFADVACHTAKWINKTGALTIDDTIRHFNADHFYDLLNDANINAASTILFYHQTKIIYLIDGFNRNVLLRKIKL